MKVLHAVNTDSYFLLMVHEHSFVLVSYCYIALISALKQTHCALVACYFEVSKVNTVPNVHRNPILSRNDCPFIARFDIHRRGVLAALFACCVAWCRVKLLPSRHTLCVHHIIMHMFTVTLI